MPNSKDTQTCVLQDNIKLAQSEKRIFSNSLETRLVALCGASLPLAHQGRQLETRQYKAALTLIDTLLTELKQLDDKMVLAEVPLLESRVYGGIGIFPKSKVRPFMYLTRSLEI
jgi:26S proteasome regulatory subunit N6